MNYSKKLAWLIPGGSHTYSRGSDQFPENAPQILERGSGAYVWDEKGNMFLDYGMALRSVALGYSYPSVNKAAFLEIEKGNNLTRASMTELKAAELMVSLIPSADMVKFCKNGSNATSAAVKIARAYTGKNYVCIPRQHPFFSFDDWFIGSTPLTRGVPSEHSTNTLMFDYGDFGSLERLFDIYGDSIAAVLMEPATTILPCSSDCTQKLTYETQCHRCSGVTDSFLHKVQALCRRKSALFILDEMITGFRWDMSGAQSYFGVKPDLSTFGKAMANGFSVAAVVGAREYMSVGSIDVDGMERTFLLSTTHGGEMCGLGAFIETVNVYRDKNVCKHLWSYGGQLREGMISVARTLGIDDYFTVEGSDICFNYITRDRSKLPSLEFRTLFNQEMIRNGVLMPWISFSLSHGDNELSLTIGALEKTLIVYREALEKGVSGFLSGSSIKPVFRKYN